jgi:hypothetical protein
LFSDPHEDQIEDCAFSASALSLEVLTRRYQLWVPAVGHLGMTSPLELYPRTSAALVGVVNLGLVQCGGDDPLLRI